MITNYKRPLFIYTLTLFIFWALIASFLTKLKLEHNEVTFKVLATTEVRANSRKDAAVRLWATRHGRIYVPVGKNYSPDPYLAQMKDRDITTPSGIKLSLINPARLIREMNEYFSHLYGVAGKVTSSNPLRPENAPDEWEKNALKRLEQGDEEVLEYTTISGKPYLRLMQPLMTQENCLLCHKNLKLNEVGGGVGIALPLNKLLIQKEEENNSDIEMFFLIWLVGSIGIAAGYIYLRREVAEKDSAMGALTSSETRNSAIMQSALDSIITIDAKGFVTDVNPATERTFGYKRAEMIGRDLAELIIPPEMRARHHEQLDRQIQTGESTILGRRIEVTAMHANGTSIPVELAVTRIDVAGSIFFTAYLRNLTESYELKEKLTYQANYDSLTGLINRRSFEERMNKIIDGAELDEQYCLLYLDLDKFKIINDSKGHIAGDELLRQLGQLLSQYVRSSDILSRLGGDEFAILLNGCSLDKSKEIANKIIEAVKEHRFVWEDNIFNIGVSIGMIQMHGHRINYSELMSTADVACYKAKEEGGNRFHVFQENDKELAERRNEMDMVAQIQQALDTDLFELYKQDIRPLKDKDHTNKIHCEILLRMNNPDGSIMTPDRFIPAAEHYNLMPAIDEWVVSNTLKWLSSLPDMKNTMKLCSINLSGYSITEPAFLSFVKEQIDAYRIPTEIICFEITETVAIRNLAKASHFMHELKKIGCQFALDDFGSGVSSFGYLKALPVDFIKIDGVFIRDIVSNKINQAMVKSINDIGKVMGKKTIAEFVENAEIVEVLKKINIDYAQGYYFSKPEPVKNS